MNPNLLFNCPYFSYPCFIPSLVQTPLPVLQPDTIPSLSLKKYQRTWKKTQVEQVFTASTKYCISTNRQLEDLNLEDYRIIGQNFKQNPEQIMMKVNEINKCQTLRPGVWSESEDELLLSILRKGVEKWGKISNFLNNEIHNGLKIRTGKMCKERWNNYLNPDINRGKWTDAEDILVLENFLKYGSKWSLIAKFIKDRTESSVKNRIKSLMNKIKSDLQSLDSIEEGVKKMIKLKKNLPFNLNPENNTCINEGPSMALP